MNAKQKKTVGITILCIAGLIIVGQQDTHATGTEARGNALGELVILVVLWYYLRRWWKKPAVEAPPVMQGAAESPICPCQNCNQRLEFNAQDAGQQVICPHCQMETTLFIPFKPDASAGIPPKRGAAWKKPVLIFGAILFGLWIIGSLLSTAPTAAPPNPSPASPRGTNERGTERESNLSQPLAAQRAETNPQEEARQRTEPQTTEPTLGNILDARAARHLPSSVLAVAHGFVIEPRFYGIKYFPPNPHPTTPAEIVTEDFHRMLGREPEPEALAFWISRGSRIRGRFDNSAVCNGITASEECIHLHHPRQPGYAWSPWTPYVELNDVLADLCEQGIMPPPTAQ